MIEEEWDCTQEIQQKIIFSHDMEVENVEIWPDPGVSRAFFGLLFGRN